MVISQALGTHPSEKREHCSVWVCLQFQSGHRFYWCCWWRRGGAFCWGPRWMSSLSCPWRFGRLPTWRDDSCLESAPRHWWRGRPWSRGLADPWVATAGLRHTIEKSVKCSKYSGCPIFAICLCPISRFVFISDCDNNRWRRFPFKLILSHNTHLLSCNKHMTYFYGDAWLDVVHILLLSGENKNATSTSVIKNCDIFYELFVSWKRNEAKETRVPAQTQSFILLRYWR